jgi:glucosamine 6-phosphate synthetase-like amidotransferase/phosphosugar isomerase protein
MCGIFGYLAKTEDDRPDLRRLRRIAEATESRGRHAFGLAWVDRRGRLHSYKRPGAATDDLGDLDACKNARAIIGHCRFATHGSWFENSNNHPHPIGSGWIVHNGVIFNYATVVREHNLPIRTDCDSEVLGLLAAKAVGPVEVRAALAIRETVGPLAFLALWTDPIRLVMARRGNPLCVGETETGAYFGSLPAYLPEAKYVPDGRSTAVTVAKNGEFKIRTVSVLA